jgi:membrane-associated protein
MLDIRVWTEAFGLLTVLALIGITVFAESGLLIGLFLPGDTLLIAVGVLAAQSLLPIMPAIAVIFGAAVLGDNVGYYIGKRSGKRLFKKRDSLFFRRAYALRAETFFKKYGSRTVLVARFIPYVRTFTPMVAGVASMDRGRFVAYNILGAFSWTVVTVFIGYWLGNKIPDITHYLYLGLFGGALFIFAPTLWHLFGNPASRRRIARWFNRAAQKQ